MLTVTGCSDDGGSAGSGGNAGSGGTAGTGGSAGNGGMGGAVDTSGACGIICEGGEQMCVVEGFDPADGPETCTRACQAQWTNEQNCASQADFVITCVDANASCDTLDDETCGDFPSSALGMLLACIEG
jgi:hypothetical protein